MSLNKNPESAIKPELGRILYERLQQYNVMPRLLWEDLRPYQQSAFNFIASDIAHEAEQKPSTVSRTLAAVTSESLIGENSTRASGEATPRVEGLPGWQLMPLKPTQAIIDAMCETQGKSCPDHHRNAYKAAIAAAPKPDEGDG